MGATTSGTQSLKEQSNKSAVKFTKSATEDATIRTTTITKVTKDILWNLPDELPPV